MTVFILISKCFSNFDFKQYFIEIVIEYVQIIFRLLFTNAQDKISFVEYQLLVNTF